VQNPLSDRLGIEQLSVFGLPPVQFVNLAADLGCRYISTNFVPPRFNPHNYPKWSLREDPALRREMIAALRDRGVSISLAEGFGVMPGGDARNLAADLDVIVELGAKRIAAVSIEPDQQRSFDQFAIIAEMTAALGVETVVEFAPGSPIPDLATTVAAIRHVGRENFHLLIDVMHFSRSGSSAADLAALEPGMIGYVQLCDVPLISTQPDYFREARYERMIPGTGELPLIDILSAAPRDVIVGIEVPQRSLAEAGMGPHERLAPCVKAARDLLSQLESR
jgi:sugar phosphate isomerase/epimerase